MRVRNALALAAWLAASTLLASQRVSRALPGNLHVGALIDLAGFLETYPELASEGFLAEQLDDLAARGVPDPRVQLSHLALGTQLGEPSGVTEGVALARSIEPLLPSIRELAEANGVPLESRAYRGVEMLTGTLQGESSRFADPIEGMILVAYDQSPSYQVADRCVDTIQGREPHFYDEYGVELVPGSYLRMRMRLPSSVRDQLDGTRLSQLQHFVSAWAELTAGNGRAQLELRARATSYLKAVFAIGLLKQKLQDIADQTDDPVVARLLLEQTQLSRSGSTLVLQTDSPRDDFVVGILALQELLRGEGSVE